MYIFTFFKTLDDAKFVFIILVNRILNNLTFFKGLFIFKLSIVNYINNF